MNPAWPQKNMPASRLARMAAMGLLALLLNAMPTSTSAWSERERLLDRDARSLPAGMPVMAVVSLREQRVTIYDADGKIMRAPVSTGQTGYETPAGIYSVIEKEAEHYSNLYDDAEMPFMQRITWSGIALHAGPLPGYAASHGCVRMPYNFAQQLFDLTKTGMRVIIAPRDVAPTDIEHPALFKPKTIEVVQPAPLTSNPDDASMRLVVAGPSLAPKRVQALKWIADTKAAEAEVAAKKVRDVRQTAMKATLEAAQFVKAIRFAEASKHRAEAQLKYAESVLQTAEEPLAREKAEEVKAKATTQLAEAQKQLDAINAEGQPKLDAAADARKAVMAAEAVRVAALDAAREAGGKLSPVTVFISRQTQRLYVRQTFQPVFDAPITITDADKPVGTHVYTALEYAKDGENLRWSAISMSKSSDAREADRRGRRYRHGDDDDAEAGITPIILAKAALDRITIPPEAMDRITEVVSPGSALIISDEPMSKETGKGTDFVVLMSDEPQGGIKIRQRSRAGRYPDYMRSKGFYQRSPYGGGTFSWW
jgi:hypothetical protein